MKKNLYLHIGTHKTGTTSLQYNLEHNYSNLIKIGYLYPKVGWHQHAQHMLAFQLHNMKNTDNSWKYFKEEVARFDGHSIILSSEEFSTLNDERIKLLKDNLSNFNVKIIIYLRRQDELFESVYNQQTKDWKSIQNKHISFFIDNPKQLYPYFNYKSLIDMWIKYFGKKNIIIERYDKKYLTNLDTVTSFFKILKINRKDIEIQHNKKLNQSVSLKALEIIRLSKHLPNTNNEEKRKIFMLATKVFPKVEEETLLSLPERRKIMLKYADSNMEIAKEFFQGSLNLFSSEEDKKSLNTTVLSRLDVMLVLQDLIRSEQE